MGLNLTQKIIKEHILSGDMIPGNEISIKIDQTLTQDSTGTMAYLQFEAMNIPKVKTKLSVAYIDHNMLQEGFENADDHKYIQTVASKHGIYFSRPGNGICHQVHLERFGVPGDTLLGSDSHTPTNGALGMLAIGAGGLDVAVAMGGGAYHVMMPKVVNVRLHNKLKPWVSAKDIILELLRILTVKGGVGKVIEYSGDGIKSLSVPQRATITNMGAELGATTSIFPSDNVTYEFLKLQNRVDVYKELKADDDAVYDEVIDIDLSQLEPLVAMPHSPDNVVTVKSIEGLKVDQVAIGSCTNSSYMDMMRVASILKGKKVHNDVSLVISPGSRQVYQMLADNGALKDIVAAGARVLECACGPCIGMGQAPATDAVSLRTFNRNFEGRSGTKSAKIYLVSPEVAAVSAIYGYLKDPRGLGEMETIDMPSSFEVNDNMIIAPSDNPASVYVVRGPNIKPFPEHHELENELKGKVVLKVGDNITTDHIMPSNAKLLPFRSNIPKLSEHCFEGVDPDFPKRAVQNGGGFIVGGINYGQGSSREHAALVPLYLGIKFILAKSYARIHKANLINNGIIPFVFENPDDYDNVSLNDELFVENVIEQIKSGIANIENRSTGKIIKAKLEASSRDIEMIINGGLLNLTKNQNK